MQQIAYYDSRWQDRPVITKLGLLRAGAIFSELSRLPLKQPTIIDLGCGTGWFAAMLHDVGPTIGVDQAISVARARYPHLTFFQADLERWMPDGPSSDVVVSQEVIEHLRDQDHYLAAAAAALKPGGFLILTTPNARVTQFLASDAWRLNNLKQPIENHLTPRRLRALVSQHFDVLSLQSIHPDLGDRLVMRPFRSRLMRPLQPWLLRRLLGLHLVIVARKKRVSGGSE